MPRWLTYVLAVLVVAIIVLALAAPIGPMPGLRIGGTPADAPASWNAAELPEEILLATYDGVLPYVVTIWVVESTGRLYVVGDPKSTWVKKATSSPDVKVRIADTVYDMRARRMPTGRIDVLEAYVNRYKAGYPQIIDSFPPLPEMAEGSALFELAPR